MLELGIDAAEFRELASQVFSQGQHLRFLVRGGSMLPFVRSGDILTLEPLANQVLHIGDILLVQTESGSLLVHRVRKFNEQGFFLQGDACPYPDGWFSRGQVLGRAIRLECDGHTRQLFSPFQRWIALVWARRRILAPVYRFFPTHLRLRLRSFLLDS